MRDGKAEPLFEAMLQAADEAESLLAEAPTLSEARPHTGAGREAAALSAAHREAADRCLRECSAAMRDAVSRASEVTAALTRADRAAALTNAHDYLTVMGHTCVAWMWLRSATAAARGLGAAQRYGLDEAHGGSEEVLTEEEANFYRGKLHTCSFFFCHELPKTAPLLVVLSQMDPTVGEMRPGWF